MNNENTFEGLISEDLTAKEQATIAGGAGLDFDIFESLVSNAIKQVETDIDVDVDFVNILNSFNFGGNSVS